MVDFALTIPERVEVIQTIKIEGGSIAAVFPIHYPRGLFRAFDIQPVEIWGPPGVDGALGSKHLQPYVCSIVRNGLAFQQSGDLNVTDFLVVPHACDSLQGLGSILLDFISPQQPVLPLYLPRGRRESDVTFFALELRQLFDRLSAITGRHPSEEALLACIYREEKADELLKRLHQSRVRLPLDNLAYYHLIRSREYLPAEDFTEMAKATLNLTRQATEPAVRLLLSGIVPEPMAMLELLSELGGMVVADDLACCGRRLYPAGASADPFRRMAERILFAPPDPTRGNPIQERLDHLLQMVESSAVQGVIFYEVKFCEPELFDLPELRRALQEEGIPSIVLEVDIGDPVSYQVRTRIESFLEMIQ